MNKKMKNKLYRYLKPITETREYLFMVDGENLNNCSINCQYLDCLGAEAYCKFHAKTLTVYGNHIRNYEYKRCIDCSNLTLQDKAVEV